MTSLPAGAWHGHFAYSFDPEIPNPTALEIALDGDSLKGSGSDADGDYEVRGSFDPETSTARWQKRYKQPGAVTVAYLGRWDPAAKELAGRWRVVNSSTHGRFALRPGQADSIGGTEARARSFLKRRAKEWQSLCKVDLEALRFDGERAMLAHLLADPDYVKVMQDVQSQRAERSESVRPDGSRVRLRAAMMPGLFALLNRCVEVLGLGAPVDLYVRNDGAINACVYTTREGRIVIEVTSGAVNQLDDGEMLYVLGHEIAHALLGHLETPRIEGGETTGLSALRSFALQRYEEISADRVGLLCCDDAATALRAEFILTTGVVKRSALGDPKAFIEHARQAVEAYEAPTLTGGFDTHPYGELRALAIELFARSKTFHKLMGRDGGEVGEAQMEREVARLVRLMNPSVVEAGLKNEDVAEFVLLAALSVAEASKGTSAVEKKAIKRIAPGHAALLKRLEEMPFEEQQIRLIDLAEPLALTLPAPDRIGIMSDLTTIARADGRVSPKERAALDCVAELLGLGVENVDDGLGALDLPLD